MQLPDVNVWLACAWNRHAHHALAKHWFDSCDEDIAFCRITQMALLRLLTQPSIMREDALTRRRAWSVYAAFQKDDRVYFTEEPDTLESNWKTISNRSDAHHRLWTDDFLAAFAQAGNLRLLTLDKGLSKRHKSVTTLLER